MLNHKRPVVYLGFNDPRIHVRGVENVIRLQSLAVPGRKYYIFRGTHPECFRWGDFIAISISMNYLTAFFALNLFIKKITQKHGTPIVHAHQYLLALLVINGPMIFTVHDALGYHKRSVGSVMPWVFNVIEFMVYMKAQKIHAISCFSWNNAFGSTFFRSKVSIIYNSVWNSTDQVCNPDKEKASLLKYYLVVRSIEERANLNLILKFAAQLQQEQSDIKILIAGKGPQLNSYKQLINQRELSNVAFLGYVDDSALNGLYCNSLCVIMPALYGEGFGLPLIEAYARGIPAVGSSVCAVPEVIYSKDLLFTDDVNSLGIAIQQALLIDGQCYMDYFEQKFGKIKIISFYNAMYRSL